MEPTIIIAQAGTATKKAQPTQEKDTPKVSLDELDSLLRDTRSDTYEKRAMKIEDTFAGLTQDQWHGTLAGLFMARHLRHTPQYKAFKQSLLGSADEAAKATAGNLDNAAKVVTQNADDTAKVVAGNLDDLLHFSTTTDDIARLGTQNIDELLKVAGTAAGDVLENTAEQGTKSLLRRAGDGLKWAKGNKLKLAGPAIDILNVAYLADRHFLKIMPWNEEDSREKVLKAYNSNFLYDTSREDEFLDVYRHTADIERKDGTVDKEVPVAQAVVYQFYNDGRITRRDGEYIEETGRNTNEIKKRSRQQALQVDKDEIVLVNINEEVKNLTIDFTTLTNAVSNFTESQLDSKNVKDQVAKLGHKLNAKLNLLKRFLKAQGDALDLATKDELKASLELLKTEASRIPTLDTEELSTLIKATNDISLVKEASTSAENPEEEEEIAVSMKNPNDLSTAQKTKLDSLLKELEIKFNSTQAYLSKQKRANNPNANVFAPDGLVTDDNYDRVVGMMEGDILDGSDYAEQDLKLSEKEIKAFEEFLQTGSVEDLNLPSMLKALKKMSTEKQEATEIPVTQTSTDDTSTTQVTVKAKTEVAENITELKQKLSEVRRLLLKTKAARESEFGKVGIWLYENKDANEDLLSKFNSGSDADMKIIIDTIPNSIKIGNSSEDHTIFNMKKAVTDLKSLLDSGTDLKTTLDGILEQSGNN
jgi:hypothetical protein